MDFIPDIYFNGDIILSFHRKNGGISNQPRAMDLPLMLLRFPVVSHQKNETKQPKRLEKNPHETAAFPPKILAENLGWMIHGLLCTERQSCQGNTNYFLPDSSRLSMSKSSLIFPCFPRSCTATLKMFSLPGNCGIFRQDGQNQSENFAPPKKCKFYWLLERGMKPGIQTEIELGCWSSELFMLLFHSCISGCLVLLHTMRSVQVWIFNKSCSAHNGGKKNLQSNSLIWFCSWPLPLFAVQELLVVGKNPILNKGVVSSNCSTLSNSPNSPVFFLSAATQTQQNE